MPTLRERLLSTRPHVLQKTRQEADLQVLSGWLLSGRQKQLQRGDSSKVEDGVAGANGKEAKRGGGEGT